MLKIRIFFFKRKERGATKKKKKKGPLRIFTVLDTYEIELHDTV